MKCVLCENKSRKRLMCEKHYRQWWRAQNPEKNKVISNKGHQKRKIKKYKLLEKYCKQCLTFFLRVRGSNRIYCSKTCQNNAMCRKKLNKPNTKLIHNLIP